MRFMKSKKYAYPDEIVAKFGVKHPNVWNLCGADTSQEDFCHEDMCAVLQASKHYEFSTPNQRTLFLALAEACVSWRKNKVIYQFSPRFSREILSTENIDYVMDIPLSVFHDFPYRAFAITYPEYEGRLSTFFNFHRDENQHLFLFAVSVRNGDGIFYYKLPMENMNTIQDMIQAEKDRIRNSHPNWTEKNMAETLEIFSVNVSIFLTMFLYLCSKNADIAEKKDGKKRTPYATREFIVGNHVGQAFPRMEDRCRNVDPNAVRKTHWEYHNGILLWKHDDLPETAAE